MYSITLRLLCLSVCVVSRSLVHWTSLGSSVSARSVPNFCNIWAVVFTVSAKFSMAWEKKTHMWLCSVLQCNGLCCLNTSKHSQFGGGSTDCDSTPGSLRAPWSAVLYPHSHVGLTGSSASQSANTFSVMNILSEKYSKTVLGIPPSTPQLSFWIDECVFATVQGFDLHH